jgi:protein-L-isoaspartate O-methyltransferase
MNNQKKGRGHNHLWIVGLLGIIIAVITYLHLPSFKFISGTVLLVVVLHSMLAIILLISSYLLVPKNFIYRIFNKQQLTTKDGKLNFGWSMGWRNLFWICAILFLTSAVTIFHLNATLIGLSFILLIVSINLIIGYIVLNSSIKIDFMTLPYVDLLRTDSDRILDAGCGAGRTTIALSKVMRNSKITAFDRFDSAYIEEGGRALLKRNIEITGISDKVEIVKGDITNMEFPQNSFDSAISTYMMDHLGKRKLEGLREVQRVLKPGGKFLLVVFVPNWSTFAVFNLLCFTLASRKDWRKLLGAADLQLKDEGLINGGVYFLVEKQVI